MRLRLLINKLLHLLEVMHVNTEEKKVYLTFDDGPEGDITDFVLDELKKHSAKATFFCKGENVEKNNKQFQRILDEGHAVGNHTYSHINSFDTKTEVYINDVIKADKVIHSHLFRPPWGSITIWAFLKLYFRFKIVYWSLMSGDTEGGLLGINRCMDRLKASTRKGDIVLFHSCKIHENETKQILPRYLEWLKNEGYQCEKLN